MRICATGSFLGRSDCGTVEALDVTASYGGVTVHHMGRADIAWAGGDSGAPMYATHNAYGMLIAGYVGHSEVLYQGITSVQNVLGADILTATA